MDVGVHRDGLVHISMLSHQFIKDPHSVVKAGDIVTVKVMEVDAARKRIALSMRLDDVPGQESKVSSPNRPAAKQPSPSAPAQNGSWPLYLIRRCKKRNHKVV